MLRPISKRRARHAREQVIPSTREDEHLVFLPYTREWCVIPAGESHAATAAMLQRAGYVVV